MSIFFCIFSCVSFSSLLNVLWLHIQKGINGKGVAQLEKSLNTKLEASLSRQLQTQFQVSGKPMLQVFSYEPIYLFDMLDFILHINCSLCLCLQNTLSSCLEGSIIPAFERACQTMFGQVDVAFQKGLSDQVHAQQQLAASSVSLVTTLQVSFCLSASTVYAFLFFSWSTDSKVWPHRMQWLPQPRLLLHWKMS